MKDILILTLLIYSTQLFAQTTKTVNVEKERFNLLEEMSLTDQYLEPEFIMGQVVFNNGNTTRAYLNYNMVSNNIIFLDDQRTAMALMGLAQIRFIAFGKRSFIPISNNQVAEVIETYPNGTSLLLHRKSEIKKEYDTRGPYGTSLETSSTDRIVTLYEQTKTTKIDQSVEVQIEMRSTYMLNSGGNFYSINRLSDLKKIYPAKWDIIRKYVKDNNLSVRNKEHIIAIIGYCNE